VHRGAVWGFLLGAALMAIWSWTRREDLGHLMPLLALLVGGPIGGVLGAAVGWVLGRARKGG
jgi:ABC-type branched-subunit amino acid transport system permease subunit